MPNFRSSAEVAPYVALNTLVSGPPAFAALPASAARRLRATASAALMRRGLAGPNLSMITLLALSVAPVSLSAFSVSLMDVASTSRPRLTGEIGFLREVTAFRSQEPIQRLPTWSHVVSSVWGLGGRCHHGGP